MAFNPFSAFRKHQKVIFAVLTIICMIVFILQFGRGDIFERLLGGHGQGKGEKVATLYGRDITSGDLDQMKQSRLMANELILLALQSAEAKAADDVLAYKPELTDPTDLQISQIRERWGRRRETLNLLNDPRLAPFVMQQLPFMQFQEIPVIHQDYAALTHMEAMGGAGREGAAKDRSKLFADLRFLLRYQYYLLTRSQSFYYGGGVKPEELLDFEIWKHQADKLGVVLTKADARRALADEAGGNGLPADPGGSWKADPAFKDYFASHGQASEDQAATAVEDEFRVRIARNLLGGPASGVSALDDANHLSPDPVSPYDFWQYYRDNRTTIKAAFLPIPVDSFLSQVTAPPSEEDLRDLYGQYRSAVPAPDKPTPGFKEPRRMKVAYVVVKTDTDYYKQWSDAAKFNLEKFYFTSTLEANLAGGGVVPGAVLAGMLNSDPLQEDYDRAFTAHYKSDFGQAAGLFGLASGGAGPLAVPAASVADAEERAKGAQLRQAKAAFESAVSAVTGTPFAGIVGPAAASPLPFSRDETITRLLDQQRKDALSEVVHDDLTQFTKDLKEEMKKAKEEAEKQNAANKDSELDPEKVANEKAEEFIRKTAGARGWELNEKAGLDDIYQMAKDEALKPLREARDLGEGFADTLFKRTPPGLYQPSQPTEIGFDRSKYLLYWRTEDQRERELSYDEARPRVLAAWRLQEARKLAHQKAEEVSQKAKQEASPVEAIKYLRDQALGEPKLGDIFELADVARLLPNKSANAGVDVTYSRYTIPADKIPYAPPDLLDRLLGLEKPGEALIFKDLPATHFYVTVLDERSVPQFSGKDRDTGFADAYRDAGQPTKAQLWRQLFLPSRERDYQKGLMRQLREDAAGPGGVNEQGQLILSGSKAPQPGPPAPPSGSEGDEEMPPPF
jgi:hypothetical protein